MKVILDTNVFMSGIFWSGPPSTILKAWQEKKIDLILSKDILSEYVRVSDTLSKKFPDLDLEEIFELVITHSTIYDAPTIPHAISRDKDDDKFIACALAANVKIIISGDTDLLEINGFNGIEIITPRKFIDIYLVTHYHKQQEILSMFGQIDYDPDYDYKEERRSK